MLKNKLQYKIWDFISQNCCKNKKTEYNKDIENGIVTFNVEGVFAQDVAAYLNKSGICVRVGNHCAKILSEVLGVKNTCRASMYFYNTKEDIDKLVEKLDNDNILYESL